MRTVSQVSLTQWERPKPFPTTASQPESGAQERTAAWSLCEGPLSLKFNERGGKSKSAIGQVKQPCDPGCQPLGDSEGRAGYLPPSRGHRGRTSPRRKQGLGGFRWRLWCCLGRPGFKPYSASSPRRTSGPGGCRACPATRVPQAGQTPCGRCGLGPGVHGREGRLNWF